MLGIDAEHGRTHAHTGRHEMHVFAFVFELLVQAVDQIQLGGDQPATTGIGISYSLDDVFGGADIIRFLADFERALGV